MTNSAPFRICVAYEDFGSGLRAKAASQRLTAGLKPQFAVVSDIWKFEMLRRPQLRDLAAAAATRANLVIISANRAGGLPTHVKTWLKAWLPREQPSPPTLIAFLGLKGNGRVTSSPLADYLRQRTAEKQVDLACHTGEALRLGNEPATVTAEHRPVGRPALFANAVR